MADSVKVYARIVAARLRSQTEYRLSFALDLLADVITQATELLVIVVLFSQVHALGGIDRTGVLLVYALAGTSFGLADLVAGQISGLSGYLLSGRFDCLLIRPMSTLGQILTSDVALRHIGRVVFALAVAGYVLHTADVHWTVGRVVLAVVAPVCGAAILSAIWVVSSSLAFWLLDAQEVTGAVTHGTNLFISYPAATYPRYLRAIFAFAIPGAFVSYYPALYLLGQPDPLGGPAALCWLTVPIAAASTALAAVVWRLAVRGYQGTGS
ncbi:ABC-2 family transporter protein [Actinomycetes bacterium KLBMP 9797]